MGLRTMLRDRVGWLHLLRRAQIPIIARLLDADRATRLLDLGCADGRMDDHLAPGLALLVACEPSDAVGLVRRRPNVRRVKASGAALPFAPAAFDRVLLSSVVQMMPDAVPLLREVGRVLAPGGRVVLTSPIGYRFLAAVFAPGRGARTARRALGLPASYAAFQRDLNRLHQAEGPGVLSLAVIERLLHTAGFEIEQWEYCPRALGSAAYEGLLLAKYCARRSVSVAGMGPMVLYPLVWLDRWLPPRSRGCEVAVVARRVSR